MNVLPYQIINHKRKKNVYKFVSEGQKSIEKIVELQETAAPNVYNLSLGDMVNRKISYVNVTDNKDTDRIMVTVGSIVQQFTLENPESKIFLTGNLPSKTRLYQMYLSNNIQQVQKHFNVYGLLSNDLGFEPFRKDRIMKDFGSKIINC